LALLRFARKRLASPRFALLRSAPLRFPSPRIARWRFASVRFALLRFTFIRIDPPRYAQWRFAPVRFASKSGQLKRTALLRSAVHSQNIIRLRTCHWGIIGYPKAHGGMGPSMAFCSAGAAPPAP